MKTVVSGAATATFKCRQLCVYWGFLPPHRPMGRKIFSVFPEILFGQMSFKDSYDTGSNSFTRVFIKLYYPDKSRSVD